MIDRGKTNVLGVGIDAIDYDCAVAKLIDGAKRRVPMSVSALAVHGVMTARADSEHRYRLNMFDLVLPDGQPVRWAMNLLHSVKLPERVYGPTFMLRACEAAAAAGLPIYLYGSREEVIERLQRRLVERIPNLVIAGAEGSKFRRLTESEKADVVSRVQQSGAAITFVGLGCPRQEVWAFEYREALKIPIVAVGAAFEFHAGTLRQAPPLMQRLGLEWFFRLIQEPRRLWRRYLYLNPQYVLLVALQLARLRRFDMKSGRAPQRELSYG